MKPDRVFLYPSVFSSLSPGTRAARLSVLFLAGPLAASCTYGPEEERIVIEQIVRIEDSYQALVTVLYERFQRPTGLSAFPDGGKSRVQARRARLYLVDASRGRVSALVVQAAPDSVWESFRAGVVGLETDSVAYFRSIGCLRGGECYPELQNTQTLRVTLQGSVRRVSQAPASASLPGVMLGRRPGEERFVRFSSEGNVVTARFDEGGPFEPLFEVQEDGTLVAIARR